MTSSPPCYEIGSVRLVNVHPGNEELDFPSSNSETIEPLSGLFQGTEKVTVRSSYSLLLDDAPKRAREKENTEAIEKLRHAARKAPPSQPAPSQTAQAAPLLPQPGAAQAAPAFEPLPGAPGPSPIRETEARVAMFKAKALALLASGEQLISSSPEKDKIEAFLHDEDLWRSAATLVKNYFTDHGPDVGRAGMDELLNSDQYGGRLKQIRQTLGG
jgi:hypothetical protein